MQVWAAVWQCYSVREQKSRETPMRLKNQEFDFVAKTVLNIDVTSLLEKIRLEYLYNFGYFIPMTLLERSM